MIEFHVPPTEALRLILNAVVELTRLRQAECKHLAIENFAPELMRNMLCAYYADCGVTITTDSLVKPILTPETPATAMTGQIDIPRDPREDLGVEFPISEQEFKRGIRRGSARTSTGDA